MTRKLNNIGRTASFAWSPGHQPPMLATGTMAGVLDDSFSNVSELEIFNLDLNPDSKSLQSSFKVNTISRFNTLAWGHSTTATPYGVIAGGMENGELELWDTAAILDNKSASDALILRDATHTGTLRALDFNLFQTNLLASAGSNSEVYIWDLANPSTPYTPGARSSKMNDISTIAWNCQVPHILSTASTNGYTVVWDLRNKKEVMTLVQSGHNTLPGGKGSISSISWHPDVATQIVTASDDDRNPIISLWDLRHAHSPEKILSGHAKGVLDVSWCRQDSDLLLSSGRDCKTLCWNPNTGKLNGELSSNHKWTFEVDWNPRNPDLFATSSFDGSINIFSIQGTSDKSSVNHRSESSDAFDTAFVAGASSAKAFELKDPPKWLRRPIGAAFGFSGKLVTFNNKIGQAAASAIPGQVTGNELKNVTRMVKIATIETDPEIVKRAEELESATKNDVNDLIEDRIQNSSKDKVDWEVLKTLFTDNAREQLMTYLGFEKDQVVAAATTLLESSNKSEKSHKILTSNTDQRNSTDAEKEDDDLTTPTNNAASLFAKSTFVDNTDNSFFGQSSQDTAGSTESDLNLSSNPTNSSKPFNLYPEGTTEYDRMITRAIMLGDFETAVNVCVSIDRFSDALMLAICGGSDLLARTQKIYFETRSKKYTYLRLLEGIVEDDLTSIVRDANLKEWASILVVLCTFAQSSDFGPLCEIIGDRLLADTELYKNAILFYLASGNLEKVSSIWISQFEQDEKLGDSTTYGIKLQELVEKVTIFRKAIDYEDNLAQLESGEYVLANLYDKYCEYAEYMAAQGKLDVAMKYINLTPTEYSSTKPKHTPGSVVRDRVFHANASKSSKYQKPSFPFEQKLLSSKESIQQNNATVVNPYTQSHNTYQSTAINSSHPASSMQPTVNYYAPSAATPQQQYSPYNQQIYNQEYNNYAPNVQRQQQYGQYTGIQASSPTSPLPPKVTGAWNDPPVLGNPKKMKKADAPSGLNATSSSTVVPAKKVTSPFVNSPVPLNYSPTQKNDPPPPIRGLGGPPPPPSSGTTVGGYYSAHQQPQQFQSQQQHQLKATLPPPPMNAVAPSPMKRGATPHQQQ